MDKNLVVETLEKNMCSLNLNKKNSDITHNEFNNFSKIDFAFNNTKFELGISLYSNAIFIIISTNSKLGSFYIGECENKDTLQPEENLIEVKCILGNRQDDSTSFLANSLITYIFTKMFKPENSYKFEKIEKIILSVTIKFSELIQGKDVETKQEYRELITLLRNKIEELLNF
jgi:hypothetical protein